MADSAGQQEQSLSGGEGPDLHGTHGNHKHAQLGIKQSLLKIK